MNPWPYNTPGIPDYCFTKELSPITRQEIRAIIMAKLRLNQSHTLVDVGAGTGSVAIEAGRILTSGRVFAIESVSERVVLIEENRRKFGVNNIQVIQGTAPEVFTKLPRIDRAFIGGSGGRLAEILEELIPRFNPEGRIVMTAVTLETLNTALKILTNAPFVEFEALAVNLADWQSLNKFHLFQPVHTVHVLAASLEHL